MRATLAWAALLLFGCMLWREGRAASLEVSPAIVPFAAGQTAASVAMTNRSDTPSIIQARIYRWSQAADQDVLAPTVEIIVSPPIFTVPAGATQTMRLLLRGKAAISGERTYRLVLDEIPPAMTMNRQIAFALRMSLPVFVGAPAAAQPALQWRAERAAAGETMLTARNAGPAYDRVTAVDVTLADGTHPKVVSHAANPYVLSGAEHHWVVQNPDPRAGGPLHVSVTSLTGRSELILTP